MRSKNLINLFQEIIREYPTQGFKGEGITVDKLYKLLAHYYKDLEALTNQPLSDFTAKDDNTSDLVPARSPPTMTQETKFDLDILLNLFKHYYEKNYEPEEALHPTGVVSYKHLWFLFRCVI
jgi:hypothetical protein